jgi:hypothetical protein
VPPGLARREPEEVKGLKKRGNPRKRSKTFKRNLEEKRMRETFGVKSPQYQHFIAPRKPRKH